MKLRDGYSQRVSKWFSRYKKRCGIGEKGKKKDFHSVRHTFVNTLKQNREVDPVMISGRVGHTVDAMTMGRYGKRYRPEVLLEAMVRNSHVICFFKPSYSFLLSSKHPGFKSFLFPERPMHPCKSKGEIIRSNDCGPGRYRPYD